MQSHKLLTKAGVGYRMTQSLACNRKALRRDLDPQRDLIKEGCIFNKWEDSKMTVEMTAESVSAM